MALHVQVCACRHLPQSAASACTGRHEADAIEWRHREIAGGCTRDRDAQVGIRGRLAGRGGERGAIGRGEWEIVGVEMGEDDQID